MIIRLNYYARIISRYTEPCTGVIHMGQLYVVRDMLYGSPVGYHQEIQLGTVMPERMRWQDSIPKHQELRFEYVLNLIECIVLCSAIKFTE